MAAPIPVRSTLSPQTGTAQRLRLLSFNVQAGISSTRPHHYVTQSWKHVLPHPASFHNLDRIAHLVRDYDLVALQEVDGGSLRSSFVNQVEYLAQHAGFAHWYCQTNRNLGKLAQHSNGLLSRVRPLDVAEHKLPGIIPGRGVIVARFGNTTRPLVVLLVHLALGKRARMQQLEFISELVNAHEHVVLMGDLNCQPQSNEMDMLMRVTDLCEPKRGLNTFPSWRPLRNIDHILVTANLHIHDLRVLNQPLSDHLPIMMEIDIPDGLNF